MGVMRVERGGLADWPNRSAGAAWRSFDPQLTIYAALLLTIGLAMAYSNSAVGGAALQPGTTFTRGLLWTAIAMVGLTAWLLVLAPYGVAQLLRFAYRLWRTAPK